VKDTSGGGDSRANPIAFDPSRTASGFASASLDETIAFGFAEPPVVACRAKPDTLLGRG
jgi:hypothetical protein